MRQFKQIRWYFGFFIGINLLISPALQALPEDEVLASPPSNQVEVVDTSFHDLKVKRLGESLKVRYSFRSEKQAEHVDVYIAYSQSQGGELLFLQPASFTTQPVPYYKDISSSTEETILELDLPGDLNLVGEHYFYAALMKAGTDISNLEVSQWHWKELSVDQVFVSR